ncbi:MAG: ABC transporter permease subunit [Actinomycetota bacterium]
MNWRRALVIARADLKQLRVSRDFWIPMLIMAGLFFVLIPTVLLFVISHLQDVEIIRKVGETLDVLPQRVQEAVRGDTPAARASFAMSVYLFAPLAVVVPLTISSAVAANAIVGEREKGTGEFLAHSPADEREIYLGKLIASLIPGYLTTLVGFGVYALVVNIIVGPNVGGWFFPTADWWLLMFWVVPPFIALALSFVVRVSSKVKSAAAAQQASGLITLPLILLAAAQSSGALFGASAAGWILGLLAWVGALIGLARGRHAVNRERLLGVDPDR